MIETFVSWTMVLTIGAIAFLGASSAAGVSSSEKFSPPRPVNMPDTATFVGGPDGGEWVNCAPRNDNSIGCIVYHPITGQAEYEWSLRFCPRLKLDAFADLAPAFFDVRGAIYNGAPLFHDRPVRFLQAKGATQQRLETERLSAKAAYEQYGVTRDCRPSSDKTELKPAIAK